MFQKPFHIQIRIENSIRYGCLGSGVGPDYLHNLLGEMISRFIPKKLDKMSDQCQIFLGQMLIIKIFIVKPGGIIMIFDDCPASVQKDKR